MNNPIDNAGIPAPRFAAMALSTTELRIAKILYWVAGLAALLYSVYVLFTMSPAHPITALLWLIMLIFLHHRLQPAHKYQIQMVHQQLIFYHLRHQFYTI